MQHPDEGMVHSWLDGALSAEESAGIESHVAGCEQCKAVVAEARGFIAASSRILTALDDVPQGVIPPAQAPVVARRRSVPIFWRAAAAMLVIAGGSLIVMRDGGRDTQMSIRATDSVTAFESTPVPAAANAVAEDESTVQTKTELAAPAPSERRAATTTSSVPQIAATTENPRKEPQLAKASEGSPGSVAVTGSEGGIAADAAAPFVTSRPSEIMLRGGIARLPLQILAVEQQPGAKRTTYQVAPGETVMLTEAEPTTVTGVATGAVQQSARARAVAPMIAKAAAPPAPPPPPFLADSAGRDSTSNALQTITWTEAATGKRLTLTGHVPVERLQEIRRKIEVERAISPNKDR